MGDDREAQQWGEREGAGGDPAVGVTSRILAGVDGAVTLEAKLDGLLGVTPIISSARRVRFRSGRLLFRASAIWPWAHHNKVLNRSPALSSPFDEFQDMFNHVGWRPSCTQPCESSL